MENFDESILPEGEENTKTKGHSYLETFQIALDYIEKNNNEENIAPIVEKIFQHAMSNTKICEDFSDENANQCRKTLFKILCHIPIFYLNKINIHNILKFLIANAKNNIEEYSTISIVIISDIFKYNRPPFFDDITDFLTTLPIYFQNIQKNSLDFVLMEINEYARVRDDPSVAQFPLLIDSYNFTPPPNNYDENVVGISSCKTLIEILNLMSVLHKYYRQNVVSIIDSLIPQMLHILCLQPSYSSRNTIMFNRDYLVDFINLQLKIMSFLISTKLTNQADKGDVGLLQLCFDKVMLGVFGIFRYMPNDIPHVIRELFCIISQMITFDKSNLIYKHFELVLRSITDSCFKIESEAYKSQVVSLVNDILLYHSDKISFEVIFVTISYMTNFLFDDLTRIDNIRKNYKLILNMIDNLAMKQMKRKLTVLMLRKLCSKLSNIYSILLKNFENEKNDKSGTAKYNNNFIKLVIRYFAILNSSFKSLVNSLVYAKANQFMLLPNQEVTILRRIFRYGILVISFLKSGIIQPDATLLKMESFEEVKTLAENFALIFVNLPQSNVVEILCNEIKILFVRMFQSSSLHHVASELINHQSTSSIFLFMYLNFFSENYQSFTGEQSAIYIRFLKSVLATSTCHRENEHILKDWVGFVVKTSMKNIIISGHTMNYLLLLRALFRSIGNSNNDQLYQEFVPSLKSILMGFIRYRTSLDYGVNLEMIIELTLSIPVRLNNLVPHIPLIMEPLTASLQTSSASNSQGHRTLEMCLEALVTLFADNPLDKVRNDIIIELCRRIRINSETPMYNLRLLGKMSGSCTKPYEDYQILDFQSKNTKCLVNLNIKDSSIPLHIDISDAIENIVDMLSDASSAFNAEGQTDSSKNMLLYYVISAWNIIKAYICAILPPENFKSYLPDIKCDIQSSSEKYCFEKKGTKGMLKLAFVGVLYSTRISQIKSEAFEIMVYTVRVCILLLLIQHAPKYGTNKISNFTNTKIYTLQPQGLISAIFVFLKKNTNTYNQNMARFIILLIVKTTETFIESNNLKIKFSETVIFKKIARRCVKYANLFKYAEKNAAVTVARQICLSLKPEESRTIIADFYILLFDCISGLYCEISSGTLEAAGDAIQSLAKYCYKNTPIPVVFDQNKINIVVCCIKQLHSYSEYARSVAQQVLKTLSEFWQISIKDLVFFDNSNIMESYKQTSASGIYNKPLSMQLAEIDALVFYSKINPPYIDWNTQIDYLDSLAMSIVSYIESDHSVLEKNPFLKNLTEITPIRLSAFKVVNVILNVPRFQNRLFLILSQTLVSSEGDILNAAKTSLLNLTVLPPSESRRNTVSNLIRPLLVKMANYQSFDMQTAQLMRSVIEVFPEMFNDKLYTQLILYLQESLRDFQMRIAKNDVSIKPISYYIYKQLSHLSVLVDCFHVMPNSNFEFVHTVLKTFSELKMNFCVREFGLLYTNLLLYLNKHPRETFDFFVQSINDEALVEIFIILLKNDSIQNMLTTHLVKNPFPMFRYVFPNIDFDHQVINLDQIENSKLYLPFKVFWIAQKRRQNFIHVFPHVLTVFRKVWTIVFHRFDEFRDKICHLICKVIFSHLLNFFDPELFLEFIMGYTIPITHEWLNTKMLPNLLKKLSFDGVVNLTNHIALNYLSSEANHYTRRNVLSFLIKIYRHKLRKEGSSINASTRELLIKPFDGFIKSKFSLESPTTLRLAILKLASVFIENVPKIFVETDGSLSSPINNILNFVKIGLKLEKYYDLKTRIQSFYVVSIIYENYLIDDPIVKDIFKELLKLDDREFKEKIYKSIRRLVLTMNKNEDLFKFMVQNLINILTSYSRSSISYHVLSIILEHNSIFKIAHDSLSIPIINVLMYMNPLSVSLENNKLLFFEMIKIIIDWGENNQNTMNHISIVLSFIIKNYIFFNESNIHAFGVTLQPVQETIDLIIFCVSKNMFHKIKINFKIIDFNKTINEISSTSQYGGSNEVTQLFKECITRIKILFAYLLKNIPDDNFLLDFIQNYVDDIIKLISNSNISDDINNDVMTLLMSIFGRFSDPFVNSKIGTLFSVCKNRICENYTLLETLNCENKDNLIRLVLLGKILPHLKANLLENVLPSQLIVLRRYNTIKHSDTNIRLEILSHLIHITSIIIADLSPAELSEVFIILSNICDNYHSFPLSIALFHVISEYIDYCLKEKSIKESSAIDFLNFTYHFIKKINLHYALEYELQVKTFTKIFWIFNNKNLFPNSHPNYYSIYLAGLLNFFHEVREMYFSLKSIVEDLSIGEKFKYIMKIVPSISITPFNSWIKLLLKILFIPNSVSSVSLSSVYDTLWHFNRHYSKSHTEDSNPYYSDNTSAIVDAISSMSEKSDNFNTELFNNVFDNLDFGYDRIKRTDKSQKYFFKNISDAIYFDGDLTDKIFKKNFNVFWSLVSEEDRKVITSYIERFLISNNGKSINDKVFVREILENCPDFRIDLNNGNIMRQGIYYYFTQTSKSDDKILKERYICLYQISNLPLCSTNTFMYAVLNAEPPIILFPSIVSFVGKNNLCPYDCALYLERYHNELKKIDSFDCTDANSPFDFSRYESPAPLHSTEVFLALETLYNETSEDLYKLSLWNMNCIFGSTATGLSLMHHGFYPQASFHFEDLLNNYEYENKYTTWKKNPFYKHESRIWRESWMTCQKELGFWGRLNKYTKSRISEQNNYSPFELEIALTSSWKVLDFPFLKSMLTSLSQKSRPMLENYKIFYYKAIYTLFNKESTLNIKSNEYITEQIFSSLRHLSKKLSHLSQILTPAHIKIFKNAHLLSELNEIHRFLSSHNISSSNHNLETTLTLIHNELKTGSKTWRYHYTEKFDTLSHLNEVTLLRLFSITKKLGHLEHSNSKPVHNSDLAIPRFLIEPFTSQFYENNVNLLQSQILNTFVIYNWIKFTYQSRKHGNYIISLDCTETAKLPLLNYQTINVSFQVMVQEAKSYLDLYKHTNDECYLSKSMDLINNDYLKRQLSKENLAIIIGIRGLIQSKTGLLNEANISFSESLLKCESTSAWAGWALMLDNVFKMSKDPVVGVNCFISYMNACKNSSSYYKVCKYITSIFQLLELDGPGGELSAAFETNFHMLSHGQVVKFIDKMVINLKRAHGDRFINPISTISQNDPQWIYSYIHLADSTITNNPDYEITFPHSVNINSQITDNKEPLNKPTEASNQVLKRIKIVSQNLHINYSSSIFYLDTFIDVYNKMNESPHETLYRLMKICINMAYKEYTVTSESDTHSKVLLKLLDTLKNELVKIYPDETKLFLNPSTLTLKEIIESLRNMWNYLKLKIFATVEKRKILTQVHKAFYSLLYNDIQMELPGEHWIQKVDTVNLNSTKIIKYYTLSETTRKPYGFNNRIRFECNNGTNTSYIIIKNRSYHENFQEENVYDLFYFSNMIFNNSKNTWKDNIRFEIPKFVNYKHNLKLYQDDKTDISLLEILIKHLDKFDYDETMVLDKLAHVIKIQDSNSLDIETISEIENFESEYLPPTIILNWVHQTYPSAVSYFTFRKKFTKYLALISFFQSVLKTLPIFPDIMVINMKSGCIHFRDISFESWVSNPLAFLNGKQEETIMRLTPNISEFITDIGIHGAFAHSLFSVATSIYNSVNFWPNILKLTFKKCSGSWKQPLEHPNENSIELIEKVSQKILVDISEYGNIDKALTKIKQDIEISCDSFNILQQDILWIPLF